MSEFFSNLVKDIQLGIEAAAGGEANVTQAAGPAEATTPQQLASEAPGINLVEGIWSELTDGRMWRSLGWILLGIVLMLLGAAWWIGPSAERASPIAVAAGALG